MTSIFSLLPILSPDLQPTEEEVECYAQIIAQCEHAPGQSLDNLRHEAELQIWVTRWAMHEENLPRMLQSGVSKTISARPSSSRRR